MSYASWKAIYYPVDAKDVPAEGALAHSLKKWEGLRPEVLKEHGLVMNTGGELTEEGFNVCKLIIDSGSCALCKHYADPGCPDCPLAQVRGGRACDSCREDEQESPYNVLVWEQKHDPEPMIAWLKKANDAS